MHARTRTPPYIDHLYSIKIDNLPFRSNMSQVERYFKKFGRVGDIYIPRDSSTHESRGFAFVRYYEERDAGMQSILWMVQTWMVGRSRCQWQGTAALQIILVVHKIGLHSGVIIIIEKIEITIEVGGVAILPMIEVAEIQEMSLTEIEIGLEDILHHAGDVGLTSI